MKRVKPRTVLLLLGAALVVGALVLGGPQGPGGPDGFDAYRRLLDGMGHAVSDADEPPARGTFVLVFDARDAQQADAVLEWVARGGRLVVANPSSQIAARVSVRSVGTPPLVGGTQRLTPACVARPAVGVNAIVVDRSSAPLAASARGAIGCYPSAGGHYVVSVSHGAGVVAVLAGPSALTNRLLHEADNAFFGLALVDGPVVFGSPAPAGATAGRGLWGTLPGAAKAILIQLALAALAFALVRARRAGRIPDETPIASIPASALVRATGNLYRSARDRRFAAALMRDALADRTARRLGLPPGTTREEIARHIARDARADEARVIGALERAEPASDAELLMLAHELEEIRRRIEGANR